MIANQGMLAFNDPSGIRPMVLGRRYSRDGIVYGFASETSCFDYLGFETWRDAPLPPTPPFWWISAFSRLFS